jgi:hypothetical protein
MKERREKPPDKKAPHKQLGGTTPALIISGLFVAPFFLYVTHQFLALPFYGINPLSWGIMLFF